MDCGAKGPGSCGSTLLQAAQSGQESRSPRGPQAGHRHRWSLGSWARPAWGVTSKVSLAGLPLLPPTLKQLGKVKDGRGWLLPARLSLIEVALVTLLQVPLAVASLLVHASAQGASEKRQSQKPSFLEATVPSEGHRPFPVPPPSSWGSETMSSVIAAGSRNFTCRTVHLFLCCVDSVRVVWGSHRCSESVRVSQPPGEHQPSWKTQPKLRTGHAQAGKVRCGR